MNYLATYKPERDLYSIFGDFDSMLENLFNRDGLRQGKDMGIRSPMVDVRENEDHYLIEAELPGFSEDEIDVKVEDNVLSITAPRKIEEKKNTKEMDTSGTGDKFVMRERRAFGFSRRFTLPRDVDVEQIKGSYKNGLLTLSLAKRAETKPRSIKVKAA
jgi:HSP20 family protein